MTAMSNSGTQTGGAWKNTPRSSIQDKANLLKIASKGKLFHANNTYLVFFTEILMEFEKSLNWGHIHMGHLQNDGQI